MVHEILFRGVGNAVPGRELVAQLGLRELRDLTALVERERRMGAPICAGVSGDERGYYLAADAGELALYLRSLDRRIKAVRKTYRALENTLVGMTGQIEMEDW